MTHTITRARKADIDEIMRIEEACFIPGIREERGVFLDRIETFPAGNLLLLAEEFPAQADKRACAGYICSEIWNAVPPAKREEWSLGHSARARHVEKGTVLYVSSFAVDPAFRGTGAGRFFFRESVALICGANPAVNRIAFIVNEAWLAARHIYETEGFRYAGTMERFFAPAAGGDGSRTAALIMEKEL